MDLDRGFPRMWSLLGRICVFLNQGACGFKWWSMIVTCTLVRGIGQEIILDLPIGFPINIIISLGQAVCNTSL